MFYVDMAFESFNFRLCQARFQERTEMRVNDIIEQMIRISVAIAVSKSEQIFPIRRTLPIR